MKQFSFWQRWLWVLSLVIIIFGLVMAVLNNTPFFDLLNHQIDPIFWGNQSVPAQAIAFRGWAYGVMGAVMAGWGVFYAFLAQFPFQRKEKWAWNCLALGTLVWYVPDTFISLLSGVILNATINTVLLALLMLPLLFTRKEFS
jgi:hypothetical protein